MKNLRNAVFTFPILPCLLFAAGDVHAAEYLALQKIMKDLGRNMQIITDGISREDWELVEKTASLIANHPQPPLPEKMRIQRFAGANTGNFKAHDRETHAQAQAVGKAAKAGNGPGVILAFQKLQISCYNCHSEFRKPFAKHFYDRQDPVRP